MKRIEYGGYHHSSVLCTYMWRMLETTLNKSYPIDTRGSFPGVKRPGHEADHSPPSSAEVKNAWSYTPLLQYNFIAWCSVTSYLFL